MTNVLDKAKLLVNTDTSVYEDFRKAWVDELEGYGWLSLWNTIKGPRRNHLARTFSVVPMCICWAHLTPRSDNMIQQ